AVAAGLDARVVRVEPAARRQSDREHFVQLVHRWVVLDGHERGAVAGHRVLPQPAVEEQLARMALVPAWPLDAAEPREPRVGHAGEDRRERADLVPGVFGAGPAPVAAHPPGELLDDPEVVARLARRVERLADPLDAPLRVRDGALGLR